MHRIGNLRRSGGTGRRAGLKIPWPQGREGSTPSSGTSLFPSAGPWGANRLRAPSGRAGTLLNHTTDQSKIRRCPRWTGGAEGPSRAAKADGVTAEAQAGDPLLRHHYFSGSYVPHGICGRVILVYCATKRKFL